MPECMYECEVKKQFVVGDRQEWRWVKVPVSKIYDAAKSHIRCAHCHGPVRVHKQRVEHGPQDHVEHLSRTDSEGCKAGSYYKGVPRKSANPVV